MDTDKNLLFISLITLVFVPILASTPPKKPALRAIFAFGDTIVDPGNNNNLPTGCRSNHGPYGINFPGEVPSGRFTNGRLPMDILISSLGIKSLLPAYSDPTITDKSLLSGVSFASSCTGLDDITPMETNVMPMTQQLKNYQDAVDKIRTLVGVKETGQILDRSLFFISAGTNDMINNIYTVPIRGTYTVSEYQDILITNLETFIKRLVSLGAVRLAVLGFPPIGCLPTQVTLNMDNIGSNRRTCVTKQNYESKGYNSKLVQMIFILQKTLPRIRIAYVDFYNPIMNIISHPTKFGFMRTLEGCCGSGSIEVGLLCNSMSQTCKDPSKYLFWDASHPTEAAYKIVVKQFQDKVLPRLIA